MPAGKQLHRCVAGGVVLLAATGWAVRILAAGPESLDLLVMDPLSRRLACACVEGYAQRDYERLAGYLEGHLGIKVHVESGDSLVQALKRRGGKRFDLVIGKQSQVLADARRAGCELRPLAMLSDRAGSTQTRGLFVVRADHPAMDLMDLAGRRIILGPVDEYEKHQAARQALERAGIFLAAHAMTAATCTEAALQVVEGKADAAVISSYAKPLLAGCRAVEEGALRVVGQTAAVPFITVFANAGMDGRLRHRLARALATVAGQADLCKVLESRDGFVLFFGEGYDSSGDGLVSARPGWPQYRGPWRNGYSPDVPRTLPARVRWVWQVELEGEGLGGVSANSRYVIVPDKSADGTEDVFHCLDAETGQRLWQLRYPAGKMLDYGNSPRATPLISGGKVYLLGALGHLHCVELSSGQVLWQVDLTERFDAPLPTWGFCASPVLADHRLIVNAGGPQASVVAMDKDTGKVLWKTPGRPANYASPVVARLGGVDQVIVYDRYNADHASLLGVRVVDGRLLWRLAGNDENYYVVPDPVVWRGRLITATEMAGLRLYDFGPAGRPADKPRWTSRALQPVSASPVVVGARLYGFDDRLICLQLDGPQKVVWESEDGQGYDHVALFAGDDRVMVFTSQGGLILLDVSAMAYRPTGSLELFPGHDDMHIWSHPALVGDRLYVRGGQTLYCLDLSRRERSDGQDATGSDRR